MSRCFPYPPPGYTLSNAKKEALIESIKLQKQKVNAEEQRKKEKRREKKEKKEKRKDKKEKNQNLDRPGIVPARIAEKLLTQPKVECKKLESEQQLELSGLTEEHEKPVCLRVPSSSSDSTENSNKRKRPSSPGDVTHGHGKIIRIKLPLKKQKQPPIEQQQEQQQPCSTSGRTHFPSQVKSEPVSRLVSESCTPQLASKNVDQGLVLKIDRQRISSIPKQIVRTPVPSASNAVVMTPMKKEELLYKNLTENWVPPQLLQNGCFGLEDNNDWLFPSKNEEKRRICRVDSISSCSSSITSGLWPKATYLPEVDVFALPFTVPF